MTSSWFQWIDWMKKQNINLKQDLFIHFFRYSFKKNIDQNHNQEKNINHCLFFGLKNNKQNFFQKQKKLLIFKNG